MKSLCLILAVFTLAGCAGPASVRDMTSSASLSAAGPLAEEVSLDPVIVPFDPFIGSYYLEIDAADFEQALSESLGSAGLLSVGAGRFLLEAMPVNISHDNGVPQTFTVVVEYTLLDAATGLQLLDEAIVTEQEAQLSLRGNVAALDAVEAAISANFAALIDELALLNP